MNLIRSTSEAWPPQAGCVTGLGNPAANSNHFCFFPRGHRDSHRNLGWGSWQHSPHTSLKNGIFLFFFFLPVNTANQSNAWTKLRLQLAGAQRTCRTLAVVAAEQVGARAIVLTGAGFTLVDLGFTALTWEHSLQRAACKICIQSNNFETVENGRKWNISNQ